LHRNALNEPDRLSNEIDTRRKFGETQPTTLNAGDVLTVFDHECMTAAGAIGIAKGCRWLNAYHSAQ
jgi:hypothetical protein